MKKGYVALLWSLLIGLIACEKEEAIITDTNQVNNWIEATMRTDYLWYEELPDKSQPVGMQNTMVSQMILLTKLILSLCMS